jgi:putative acetyltransferase
VPDGRIEVVMRAAIRDEAAPDRAGVRRVNERAFGQPAEADLVEALHRAAVEVISLVAEVDGQIVGHILFSPVTLEPDARKRLLGLAPMAVDPDWQRQGIGSDLVRTGLARAAAAGFDGVVVLGHPAYYPRFGFRPAAQRGLRCEYDVPPEVFLVLECPSRSLDGVRGLVRYHEAFGQA